MRKYLKYIKLKEQVKFKMVVSHSSKQHCNLNENGDLI